FVRDSHVKVIGRAQFYTQQVNGNDLANGCIHFDHITDFERFFNDQKQATDNVGGRRLGGKADSNRQNARGAQQHFQRKADFSHGSHRKQQEDQIEKQPANQYLVVARRSLLDESTNVTCNESRQPNTQQQQKAGRQPLAPRNAVNQIGSRYLYCIKHPSNSRASHQPNKLSKARTSLRPVASFSRASATDTQVPAAGNTDWSILRLAEFMSVSHSTVTPFVHS